MRKQYSATFKAEAVKALLKEDKTIRQYVKLCVKKEAN